MSSRATMRSGDYLVRADLESPYAVPGSGQHDDGLVRAAALGDPAAFEKLASAYDLILLRMLLALTPSEQDALDLCHATLLAAYRELPRRTGSIYVWLHRLAAIEWLLWAKNNSAAAAPGCQAAWKQLSAKERLVFTLKNTQHMTLRTIAQILEESEEAVGRTFSRAVFKLRLAPQGAA